MKAGARIAVVGATSLIALLPGTGLAGADPADPPRTCTLPADLTDTYLVMHGTAASVPDSPAGNSMTMVRFPAPGVLRYMVAGTGIWHEGTYTFSSPEPGIGVLDATRSATQPDGSDLRTYTLTLRCQTDDTGDYTYTTGDTPSAGPENTAVYRLSRGSH